jgi:nicotinamide-nucleotide amidase
MMEIDDTIFELAAQVIEHAKTQGVTLGCVESCTGGMLGSILTSLPGSSDAFAGGLVTYSDEVKTRLAGVDPNSIQEHGAVSSPVAAHMAMGGMSVLGVDRCVSITGIAGPGGGSEDKPVGTVWFGLATKGNHEVKCTLAQYEGDRHDVRTQAVELALRMLDVGAVE